VSGTIYAEAAGDGVPLLAVHGLGGGAHFFGGLAKRLCDACRVVSVDLPGTGRSARAGGSPTMDSWARDLGSFVSAEIGEPVVLIGHSMGTMVALHAWRAWPDLIRGLIFVGGLPRVRPVIRERLSTRQHALSGASDLASWGPRVSPGNFSSTTLQHQPEVVALFERLFEAQPVEQYTHCLRILLETDATALAHTIFVPALAITGVDDQYAPPDAVQEFARSIPSACEVKILDNAGHLPFLEQPDAFAALVKSFVRTC
jgi:pimeloyl-ACP methyl ester carboxylesterase